MTKKIAVINDLSGFGRCSLTAAISVISAMGVQPCPLPTAILTAQTGYPSYYCDDYTEKMKYFRQEWKKMGESFDGIYTGFVTGEEQIRQIFDFLDDFYRPGRAGNDTNAGAGENAGKSTDKSTDKSTGNFLLVDPVLGDDGETYDFFTPGLQTLMRRLALRADIITPNLTELCLLTDTSYEALIQLSKDPDPTGLFKKTEELARQLCQDGPTDVVVTGIQFTDKDGVNRMGNLHVTADTSELTAFPLVGGSYSGTGDLFASCLAGGTARGDNLSDSIRLAGNFLENAMTDSVCEGVPEIEGVNYEKYLMMLIGDGGK